MKFSRVLVANRGEIALRIMRTCQEMGIETVAVYSEADEMSLHVQAADYAVCVGPGPASESYLSVQNIIAAAKGTGCDAVHPGYGFLAENADFVDACEAEGLVFIGPQAAHIRAMGDKAQAKRSMIAAGVPVVPGSDGAVTDLLKAQQLAKEIGFPLMIKASAGGGGKGLRIAPDEQAFARLFTVAQEESKRAFQSDEMYLEKQIINPKHIEVQILADKYGHVIHLGERDCSMQRNHQKVIEETPSPGIDEDLRRRMGEDAVNAVGHIGYENAGTVEFVLDADQNYYFIEMNTRIQVEHPVTEMVTGIDLIEEMIRIAMGEPLTHKQEEIVLRGAAMECRINAEDPKRNFAPQPGSLDALILPGGHGIRVDTFVYQGYTIPPFYDSMIAKIITHGKDRETAIRKMRRALGELLVLGVETTVDLNYEMLMNESFLDGSYHTGSLRDFLAEEA